MFCQNWKLCQKPYSNKLLLIIKTHFNYVTLPVFSIQTNLFFTLFRTLLSEFWAFWYFEPLIFMWSSQLLSRRVFPNWFYCQWIPNIICTIREPQSKLVYWSEKITHWGYFSQHFMHFIYADCGKMQRKDLRTYMNQDVVLSDTN